ncbi:Protein CBG08950 [Caenorhabditis briggsae]|nr:Protein CBG08950 [Caenorhabditis briggsae]CAP28671.1 Protein CBG08950 [Caenorhabditis briggsae]
MANQTLPYCPDHIVPVAIEDVVGTKTETITFGKILVNRVKLIGIVGCIELLENGASFGISNLAKTHHILVTKFYTEAFPRTRCAEFIIPDYVEVFGKIRIIDGTAYVNAFHLNVLSKEIAEVNEIIIRNSRSFYAKNKPSMPDNTPSVVASLLGLGRKVGNLSRFPIDMLEPSPVVANNGGVLPSEIEMLAEMPNGQRDDSSDCSDEEELDSEEGGAADEDYEDEEEEEHMEEEEKEELINNAAPHFD